MARTPQDPHPQDPEVVVGEEDKDDDNKEEEVFNRDDLLVQEKQDTRQGKIKAQEMMDIINE